MTLFKTLLAAMMIVSSLAQANGVSVNQRGDRNVRNDYGPVNPERGGGDYGPVMPYPGDREDDRYERPGRGRTEEIYLGRYFRNEPINLLRELSHLRGSQIQSVKVYVQRSRDVRASLDLLVNNLLEDSRPADIGRAVTLNPRSFPEIGRLRNLEVYVNGEMLLDRIVVELLPPNNRPPPYQDGREIAVTVNLPSYLPPQPRLDLTPYIDVRGYRGYTIKGIEITAVAVRNNASLDVSMNGFSEGRVILSPRQTTQVLRSRQNLVLGSSFGNLILAPRGDSNIIQVRLLLSRR